MQMWLWAGSVIKKSYPGYETKYQKLQNSRFMVGGWTGVLYESITMTEKWHVIMELQDESIMGQKFSMDNS